MQLFPDILKIQGIESINVTTQLIKLLLLHINCVVYHSKELISLTASPYQHCCRQVILNIIITIAIIIVVVMIRTFYLSRGGSWNFRTSSRVGSGHFHPLPWKGHFIFIA